MRVIISMTKVVSTFIADIYDKLSDEKKNEAMDLMGDTLTTELNRRKG